MLMVFESNCDSSTLPLTRQGLSRYNQAPLPLSRQGHRGRARTPNPFGQRGNIGRNPIIEPRTSKARVEARRRALGGRCGRCFGFAVASLLRVILSFLAGAALHEFLAVAPGALQAGASASD